MIKLVPRRKFDTGGPFDIYSSSDNTINTLGAPDQGANSSLGGTGYGLQPGQPITVPPTVPVGTKYVPKGTSGNNEDDDTSGKNKLLGPTLMPNVRPWVDVLNFALQNKSINDIRKTELGRKNIYFNTPSLSVRPIQDLTPEVLGAQQNALTQIRSDYAGSDPVMNAIMKNMATSSRNKTREEQIAGRATAIAGERTRFDTENRANQAQAAATAKENAEREQTFEDYKLGANTAAEEAHKTANASFLSQIGANLDTSAQFNLQRKAYTLQQHRQDYEDAIKEAEMLPPAAREAAVILAKQTWQKYAAQSIPNFSEAQRGALTPRLPFRWSNLYGS